MKQTRKQLIISFHDLHPGSWESCRRFIEKSWELGAQKMTLLVIPQYHGQPPFTENSAFVEWLQNLPTDDFDLCLHGYYHQADAIRGNWFQQLMGNVYTTGEGEFYQLSQKQAQEKLAAGMSLFLQNNLPVFGFTAPAWLLSQEARSAVRDSGFLYNTLWDGVELPASKLFIKAPTLVYSSRNAWRRAVSKLWISIFYALNRKAQVLRIAVHPTDFKYPDIEAHLYKVLKHTLQTRTTSTYRDLIPVELQKPVSLA
ncbi:MAG: polysaccharide deacetylase family protein [Verrucomicrobia bacterium]|nr:polysaccharide deacetylase family protein [Verrucomicrobiota bacterium]